MIQLPNFPDLGSRERDYSVSELRELLEDMLVPEDLHPRWARLIELTLNILDRSPTTLDHFIVESHRS